MERGVINDLHFPQTLEHLGKLRGPTDAPKLPNQPLSTLAMNLELSELSHYSKAPISTLETDRKTLSYMRLRFRTELFHFVGGSLLSESGKVGTSRPTTGSLQVIGQPLIPAQQVR